MDWEKTVEKLLSDPLANSDNSLEVQRKECHVYRKGIS